MRRPPRWKSAMTKTLGYSTFSTAIGACAVAWSADALTAVQLPEGEASAARARMRRRFPDAPESEPPPFAQEAIAGICALVGGERRDLTAIPLDMERLSAFAREIY